jgi:heme/copper-type cytochrome/quinol oxidase subunit 3
MSAVDLTDLPVNLQDRRSTGWWGMVLAIATEATLFGSLLSAYFYLRFNSETWPPAGVPLPELRLASIGTAVLVSSSVVLVGVEAAARRGRVARVRFGLLLTTVLGVVFLVIQGFEYASKGFGISDHAYGSAYYAITGLHSAHVVAGLLMLGFIQVRAWTGQLDADRHQGLQNAAVYWHFVDVVWIAVFSSLYLSEHLS